MPNRKDLRVVIVGSGRTGLQTARMLADRGHDVVIIERALNAVVIASSRVAFSMGREGPLLPPFGNLHHRHGTPFVAVLASAVVMLGSIVLPTASAGNMSSLFFLLSFIIVNGAVIKLRRERPSMRRPYEIPYYPIPPVLGIVLNLVLTVVLVRYLLQTDQLALLLSLVWIILGVVAYFAFNWLRSSTLIGEQETSEKPDTVTESSTEESD